jgi:hypothetical protein
MRVSSFVANVDIAASAMRDKGLDPDNDSVIPTDFVRRVTLQVNDMFRKGKAEKIGRGRAMIEGETSGAGETGPNPATVRTPGGLRLAIAPPRDIAEEPPRRLASGLREGGPAFCRKDRLCNVVHPHLFESCKRYGKPARLGRSCPRAVPYPRASRFSPVTAYPFPVQPN